MRWRDLSRADAARERSFHACQRQAISRRRSPSAIASSACPCERRQRIVAGRPQAGARCAQAGTDRMAACSSCAASQGAYTRVEKR